MGRMVRCDTNAAASLQCRARANTPAVWLWLCPVLNDGKIDESIVQGVAGGSEYAIHRCLVKTSCDVTPELYSAFAH